MIWILIISAGIITFLTRYSMIAIVKKEYLTPKVRFILSYIPCAIFPSIIFPLIFLDPSGVFMFQHNPRILAGTFALMVGIFTKNIIATIISGLAVLYLLNNF